jgi:hypothetical protein
MPRTLPTWVKDIIASGHREDHTAIQLTLGILDEEDNPIVLYFATGLIEVNDPEIQLYQADLDESDPLKMDLQTTQDGCTVNVQNVDLIFGQQLTSATDALDGATAILGLIVVARSSGSLTFAANPVDGNTLPALNGFNTIIFKAAAGDFPEIQIGADLATTLATLAAALNEADGADPDNASLLGFEYFAADTRLTIVAIAGGSGGDSFTLGANTANITRSGATLTGGDNAYFDPKIPCDVIAGAVEEKKVPLNLIGEIYAAQVVGETWASDFPFMNAPGSTAAPPVIVTVDPNDIRDPNDPNGTGLIRGRLPDDPIHGFLSI